MLFVDATAASSADLAAVESDSRDNEVVAASTDAKFAGVGGLTAEADSTFVVGPPP